MGIAPAIALPLEGASYRHTFGEWLCWTGRKEQADAMWAESFASVTQACDGAGNDRSSSAIWPLRTRNNAMN